VVVVAAVDESAVEIFSSASRSALCGSFCDSATLSLSDLVPSVASANRRFEDSSDASIVGDPLRLSDDDISVAVMLGIGGVFIVPIRDAGFRNLSVGDVIWIWLLLSHVWE
jgi:hypothetical protein